VAAFDKPNGEKGFSEERHMAAFVALGSLRREIFDDQAESSRETAVDAITPVVQ